MVYPTSTPDYGTYQWFRHRLGVQMGWGADPDSWGRTISQEADSIIEAALMSFYFPPPVDQQLTSHRWSFLNPTGTIGLATGQQVYPLPDDFENTDGDITFVDDQYDALKHTTTNRIEKLTSMDDSNGPPQYFATRPSTVDGVSQQTQELLVYPMPDSEYTMNLPYTIIPKMISDDSPYPLGGRVHVETIRCGMLAEAELRATGKEGPHFRNYKTRLISSVVQDQKRAPTMLGYNGDPSIQAKWTRPGGLDRWRDKLDGNVTYE